MFLPDRGTNGLHGPFLRAAQSVHLPFSSPPFLPQMTRLPLLGLAGVLFAAAPAGAQTTDSTMVAPTMADSTMMSDSTMAATVDTPRAIELNTQAVALERSDFAGALTLYDQALVADPTYPPALLGRGNMLSQLGRNEEARSSYEASAAAAAERGADYARVGETARTNAGIVAGMLAQQAEATRANAAAEQQAAAVGLQSEAIDQATALLATDPFTPEVAQQVYDQLERAREAGYDANLLAFQYARSLNTLGRGADALSYAQQALSASTDEDKSAYYIQLGISKRLTGDDPGAREAFTSAKAGSWAGWADYYLAEMGPATP